MINEVLLSYGNNSSERASMTKAYHASFFSGVAIQIFIVDVKQFVFFKTSFKSLSLQEIFF